LGVQAQLLKGIGRLSWFSKDVEIYRFGLTHATNVNQKPFCFKRLDENQFRNVIYANKRVEKDEQKSLDFNKAREPI